MIILKSAAYYALTDEEPEEILSCDNEPVIKAYVVGLLNDSVPGGLPSLEVCHAT